MYLVKSYPKFISGACKKYIYYIYIYIYTYYLSYSFADEPKEKRKIKLSRGNLGISTGFKNSLKTPAKEKDFVKAIILGAGSNYNYMDPTFEGITIKEEGKQKTGELSYGAQFGELKVSKQDYDQKVVNILCIIYI